MDWKNIISELLKQGIPAIVVLLLLIIGGFAWVIVHLLKKAKDPQTISKSEGSHIVINFPRDISHAQEASSHLNAFTQRSIVAGGSRETRVTPTEFLELKLLAKPEDEVSWDVVHPKK